MKRYCTNPHIMGFLILLHSPHHSTYSCPFILHCKISIGDIYILIEMAIHFFERLVIAQSQVQFVDQAVIEKVGDSPYKASNRFFNTLPVEDLPIFDIVSPSVHSQSLASVPGVLYNSGASYIHGRVHNIKFHKPAFASFGVFNGLQLLLVF